MVVAVLMLEKKLLALAMLILEYVEYALLVDFTDWQDFADLYDFFVFSVCNVPNELLDHPDAMVSSSLSLPLASEDFAAAVDEDEFVFGPSLLKCELICNDFLVPRVLDVYIEPNEPNDTVDVATET